MSIIFDNNNYICNFLVHSLFFILICFIPIYSLAASSYLFGNWGGKRLALEESGYKFEASSTIDLMTNLDGVLMKDLKILVILT